MMSLLEKLSRKFWGAKKAPLIYTAKSRTRTILETSHNVEHETINKTIRVGWLLCVCVGAFSTLKGQFEGLRPGFKVEVRTGLRSGVRGLVGVVRHGSRECNMCMKVLTKIEVQCECVSDESEAPRRASVLARTTSGGTEHGGRGDRNLLGFWKLTGSMHLLDRGGDGKAAKMRTPT